MIGEEDGCKIFAGVRFILMGFDDDTIQQSQVRSKLLIGGGVDVGDGGYTPICTHLIVHKDKIVYNHSDCAVARADGKTVVTALWVEHCTDVGMLVDATSILYRPVKDLNGIPGAKALSICLTGYQRQDRDDIMKMVGLMGAHFSKPLIANRVTHLICYKFEGEKYELAKKLKKIKLVNHCWLEDCLRAWEILPECSYSKSGYELEIMEAEAKDSEEETEENKCPGVFGENIGDTGSKAHLHGGKGGKISKESDISVSIHQNEAGKQILSGKVEGNINDKRSVGSPGAGNREGAEHTYQGIGANVCKVQYKLSLNPETAAKRTPFSDAATPVVSSYSRKSLGPSPVQNFPGVLSNNVHGSAHPDSKQLNGKDCSDVSQQIDQIKYNLDLGNNHEPRNESEFHTEREGNLRLPLKRKSSVSNVSSRSPCKEAAIINDCATRSPSASAILTGRPQIQSTSLNGNGGYCFEKYDVHGPASNQSVNHSKSKHLIDNGTLNCELPSSRTSFSGGTEFPSGLKQSNRAPGASLLALEQSKFRTASNIGDNEVYNLIDKEAEAVERLQNIRSPSLKSENEPRKSADLGVHNGCTNDTISRSLPKRIAVKKGFGSKSKLSSSTNKQKGTLCLKTKNASDEVMISTGDGKEVEHLNDTGLIPELAGPHCKAETLIEKATGDLVYGTKVENAAASEDDETEAPEEEIGTKLEKAARGEITKSDLPENVAEVACCLAFELTSDITLGENATVIMEKDEIEVAEGAVCKSGEVVGSPRKDKMVKERNNVVKKSKKSSVDFGKKMVKCGKEKAVVPENKNGEEKVVKKKNRKQDPAEKQKGNTVSLDKEEKPMDEIEGNKLIENIYPIEGKQIEGKNICNGTAISENDGHEVVATNRFKSVVVGGSIEKEEMVKGRNNVSSKSKKPFLSVAKRLKMANKGKEVQFQKINDEEVKEASEKQCTSGKQKSKPVCLKKTEISLSEAEENKSAENRYPMQGKKIEGKKNLLADSKRSKMDKKVELVRANDDKKLDIEIAKDVHHLASKSKSSSGSLKKAQMHMEEDKENKPTETGTLGAKSGKHKRDVVDTELNRTSAVTGKDACEANADGMLLGEGSKRERFEPVLFILSGHRLQRKEFQQIIRRLKGKVCRDSHYWSYQATHLILPDPIRRTEKFFAAAASGRWILKTDYLAASNQAGKLLPEEPYEWFSNGFSEDGAINLEAPRKWRLLRERTGHGAFYKMRIVVYGECIAPSLDTLKRVVKAGDGIILATCPPYTRFLGAGVDFAIVSPGMSCVDSWVQEFLRHEIPCVVADYLVEYVCKTGCSLEKHVLYETHVWAEKSFAKLLSSSEEIVEDDSTAEEDDASADISCQVCESRDRAEVMLICGDESGSSGCGVGIHIDCCDPPFEVVPEEDWLCPKCIEVRDANHPKKKTKKGPTSRKQK